MDRTVFEAHSNNAQASPICIHQQIDGKILNEPVDLYNHAMDAGRYAMESLKPNKKPIMPMTMMGGIKPYYPSIGI